MPCLYQRLCTQEVTLSSSLFISEKKMAAVGKKSFFDKIGDFFSSLWSTLENQIATAVSVTAGVTVGYQTRTAGSITVAMQRPIGMIALAGWVVVMGVIYREPNSTLDTSWIIGNTAVMLGSAFASARYFSAAQGYLGGLA